MVENFSISQTIVISFLDNFESLSINPKIGHVIVTISLFNSLSASAQLSVDSFSR